MRITIQRWKNALKNKEIVHTGNGSMNCGCNFDGANHRLEKGL